MMWLEKEPKSVKERSMVLVKKSKRCSFDQTTFEV